MYVYLLGYLLLFLGSILWFRTYPKVKIIYAIGLLYIFILIVFRGNVGTDTGTYESIIDMIDRNTWTKQVTEFGFSFSIALLKSSNLSSPIILRILTACYVFLLTLIIYVSKENIRQVIMVYFIPATIYVLSMNALRLGLAINLLILALLLYQRYRVISYACLIASLSFHVTVFILIPLLILLGNLNYKLILGILLSIIISGGIMLIFQEHIENKLSLYSNYASPSIYSGLSNILIFIVLLCFCVTYPISQKYKLVFSIIMIALVVCSFIIAKFSYAGLRLLQLFIIFMPLLFIYLANVKYRVEKMPKHSFWILFFSSFMTAIFTLRNFLDSEGAAFAFIPYTFIFN